MHEGDGTELLPSSSPTQPEMNKGLAPFGANPLKKWWSLAESNR